MPSSDTTTTQQPYGNSMRERMLTDGSLAEEVVLSDADGNAEGYGLVYQQAGLIVASSGTAAQTVLVGAVLPQGSYTGVLPRDAKVIDIDLAVTAFTQTSGTDRSFKVAVQSLDGLGNAYTVFISGSSYTSATTIPIALPLSFGPGLSVNYDLGDSFQVVLVFGAIASGTQSATCALTVKAKS